MKKKNKFFIKIFITIIIIFITISRNIFYYNTKKICTREIIFGLISELSVDKTFTFFKSLQKVKYDGKIIVFVDKKENCQYYNHLNIEYLYFNSNYPYYPVNHHLYPISTSFINNIYPNFTEIKKNYVVFLWILRYYLIYSFITHYGNDKDIYLFSDIKDVIFQKNPFNWKYKSGVYLVEESKIKSLREATQEWMNVYTTDEKILEQRVLNGGVIFGTSNEVKLFLNEFLCGYNSEGKNGVDQAYLNYFYYSNNKFKYPIYVCESNKCFCKCIIQEILHTRDKIINETDMMIHNSDGSIPCLIHQYTFIYQKRLKYRNELFQNYIKKLTE